MGTGFLVPDSDWLHTVTTKDLDMGGWGALLSQGTSFVASGKVGPEPPPPHQWNGDEDACFACTGGHRKWHMWTGSADREAVQRFQRLMPLLWTLKWQPLAGRLCNDDRSCTSLSLWPGESSTTFLGFLSHPPQEKKRGDPYSQLPIFDAYLQTASFDNKPSWAHVAAERWLALTQHFLNLFLLLGHGAKKHKVFLSIKSEVL